MKQTFILFLAAIAFAAAQENTPIQWEPMNLGNPLMNKLGALAFIGSLVVTCVACLGKLCGLSLPHWGSLAGLTITGVWTTNLGYLLLANHKWRDLPIIIIVAGIIAYPLIGPRWWLISKR